MQESASAGANVTKTGAMMGVLGLVLLVGCQDNLRSTTTGAASNVPARPQASAEAIVANGRELGAVDIEGTWMSRSCGERAYPRFIVFEAGGRFSAEDRISPCPQGAQCVWAGIVYRAGTYSVDDDAVQLKLEGALGPSLGAPFPERLKLDPGPVEVAWQDGGDAVLCVYEKR